MKIFARNDELFLYMWSLRPSPVMLAINLFSRFAAFVQANLDLDSPMQVILVPGGTRELSRDVMRITPPSINSITGLLNSTVMSAGIDDTAARQVRV